MIFLRGVAIGVEQMTVFRSADGWDILSTGRLGPPLDVVARKLEVRYTADWKPLELTLDSTVRGEFQKVFTTIDGTTATIEVTTGTGTEPTRKAETIDPNCGAPAERVLQSVRSGGGPVEECGRRIDACRRISCRSARCVLRVGDSTTEQIQTATRLITARKTRVTASSAGNDPRLHDLGR